MNTIRNRDVQAGKWKQLHGTVEQWWGRLTGDDQKRLSGRFEVLVGVLQERFGRSNARAENGARRFVERVNRTGAS